VCAVTSNVVDALRLAPITLPAILYLPSLALLGMLTSVLARPLAATVAVFSTVNAELVVYHWTWIRSFGANP
jgi:hypothetical protein